MKPEASLKVQAWLDGELGEADLAEVLRLVREDPEAAALSRELKFTRQWMAAGEPPRPVPESREFYWSKINRQLAPREATATSAPPVAGHWWRWIIPATALTAVTAALLLWPREAPRRAGAVPAEVETPIEDAGSFTFRSDSEQMTVVWVSTY